ncbi:G-type lectin S-receptor-like serine/threonine-protein kinase [Citrus sinensis]|uniref:G-type lectin S-receptor-like serine/threonine-protein kinase n=1 Tax=Citrus sinensis TaxID=2711 RepID=A0ACB8NZK9_CITSI|nr:G-type lectin S-receptor-like serine/threonine-protein kinase [Citrus sinensis]KAH9803083.1 G-type lectin S-receptor-like serine/threonine-protein kinase [Citrus sinensis]
MGVLLFLFVCCNLLFFLPDSSFGSDTITSSQSLSDGRTLVSKDGSFELGFFSPGSSKNRYIGIWYKSIPVKTVVWVANRLNPINDSSGLLIINKRGNLILKSQSMRVVWSASLSKEVQQTPVVLQLLDSGNLVLRGEQEGDSGTYFWQSFDYPSDTLLPGMKLGWDLKTGFERRVISWKSADDPSPGDFIWAVERQDNPEVVMWKGSSKFYTTGPWNGLSFSAPTTRPNPIFNFSFVANEDELCYTFSIKDKAVVSRIVMNQTTYLGQRFTWSNNTQTWDLYSKAPRDECDTYGLCGAYGVCIISKSPVCQCLKGFKTKSGGYMDWHEGCVRSKALNYSRQDGFIKFTELKLPDANFSRVSKSVNLKECREKCLENSSCMAYTNSDIRGGGSGCAMWFGDLIDMRSFPDGGQDFYIRMSASELGMKGEPTTKIVVLVISAVALLAVVLISGYLIHKRRRNIAVLYLDCICFFRLVLSIIISVKTETDQENEDQNIDLELPLFELATISNATNNFSINNKLGEGGFGPVYKGTLVDGQEIAVKRLSKISDQGLKELKNEVILFSKLQHRNLVKLLGCCIHGEEKLLIYEFMPNKSLDYFIFDQTNSKLLDWSKRFHIICGTARGLLYLHQDSRLRIIHRDLKASNVLLDHDMNPKISDFGLARTCGGDKTEGNTNRVVGTYGYMAPEYASDGLFSTKSDVFSFGILLLEIVSGKKNRGFYHSDHSLNLIGHAWKLWNEGMPLQLIDACYQESCNRAEVIRCVHISLLCVQQHPDDRPSMPSVILMLGSEIVLPQPKQPGFLANKKSTEPDSSSSMLESSSTNTITISELEGR